MSWKWGSPAFPSASFDRASPSSLPPIHFYEQADITKNIILSCTECVVDTFVIRLEVFFTRLSQVSQMGQGQVENTYSR